MALLLDGPEQGAAFDLEDNEIGIRCVSATTPYMAATRMRTLVPVAVRICDQVSRRLGHLPGAACARHAVAENSCRTTLDVFFYLTLR
jgi:hypothetical protein